MVGEDCYYRGDFEDFDAFLRQHGSHVEDITGLPEEEELWEAFEIDVTTDKERKKRRGRELGARQKNARAEKRNGGCREDLNNSEDERRRTEAAQAERGSSEAVEAEGGRAEATEAEVGGTEAAEAERGRAEAAEAEKGGAEAAEGALEGSPQLNPDGVGVVDFEETYKAGERAERAEEEEEKPERSRPLSEEIVKRLLQIPEGQFIFSKKYRSLKEALQSGPGLLDCFSGQRGCATAMVARGAPWALCWDLKHHPSENLLSRDIQSNLLSLVSLGAFAAMSSSPVCASFSTAITPPWRNLEHPEGRPDLTEEQQLKVEQGHEQLDFTLRLVAACLKHRVHFWVENPQQSWFWKQRGRLSWQSILESGLVGDLRVDQCRFGTPWRKRTRFRTSCYLAGSKVLCQCGRRHVQLRGRCKEAKMNFTKMAESYPRPLCDVLACAMVRDAGFDPRRRRVNLADIAKAGGGRIGEAGNPGPRRARTAVRAPLEDFQLLEPLTIQMRARFWAKFQQWMHEEVGPGALENFLGARVILVKALEAYGQHQYASGVPLHYFRQLLAHVQREYPLVKPFMSTAWLVVSRWELAEPVVHRVPVPEPLVRAAACVALAWGWPEFAASVLFCFYGITRIGEILKAHRGELLTDNDLLTDDGVIYIRVRAPKTRNRGARVQYSTVSEPDAVRLAKKVWERLEPHRKLVGFSAGTFRRRWNPIFELLGIEKKHNISPGSLRGGGAVWAHKKGLHIQDLLWKMRLQHARTLAFYLQETTAASVLPSLPKTCRDSIQCLQGLLPFYIDAFEPRIAADVISAHGFSWIST